MAKISTLQDTFSGGLNTSVWNLNSGAQMDPTFSRVQLPIGVVGNTVLGSGTYDLGSSSIYAKVMTAPNPNAAIYTRMRVYLDSLNYAEMQLDPTNAFILTLKDAGAGVNHTFTVSSYSQSRHAYWRVREASGTVYFDTSPDAATWTNQWSNPRTWAVTAVSVSFTVGCTTAPSSPVSGFVDDVNATSGIEIEPLANSSFAYMSLNLCGLSQYDTLIIQRTNADGSISTVRSANGVAIGNAEVWTGVDYEAPLGANVTYSAIGVTHNSDGSTSTSPTSVSATVMISVPSGTCWIKSLSQPSISAQFSINTIGDVTRPARLQEYVVIGRSNPVVISDVRGGRKGDITVMTTTDADRSALGLLMADGHSLFIQFTAADGFTDMYFVPTDTTSHRPASTSTDPTRLTTFGFIEIDSPSGLITTLPGNSYLLVTNFGTYQALYDHRASYLAVLNTPYGSGSGGL